LVKRGDGAVKLMNEFIVAVPLERAWETLLDIERVAGFLPGAKIEPSSEDGVYRGSMRVKVGPMVVTYEGTARLVLADETEHIADIAVEARESKGQGTASAVIRNRLVQHDSGTRVIAETNLNVTGRQAQFGRGIMQDIAGRTLDDFARRFEAYLLEGEDTQDVQGPGTVGNSGPTRPTVATTGPPLRTEAGSDALDLGSLVFRTPAVRRIGLATLGALVVAILALTRRRGRCKPRHAG
jgi:carbon monoxide dehydrogenase subunit G